MTAVRAATVAAPAPQLTDVSYIAAGTSGLSELLGMLADRQTLVGSRSSNVRQLGVSTDGGTTWTWGRQFESSGWVVTGLIETPDGEVLVSARHTSNTAAGTLWRSTGWNKTTADATTWTKVLTASGAGCYFDRRWCLTARSVAPAWSRRAGQIVVCEYGTTINNAATPAEAAVRAWRSTDNGATWTAIFDLRDRYPGVTAQLHVHAIAYDPHDDRVLISTGDGGVTNGACAVWYCDGEDLATPTWTALSGSESTNAATQVTTIVPLESGIVLLSDSSPGGVRRIPRRGFRRYGQLVQAAPIPGGIIGGAAWRNPDQPGAPLLMTYASTATSGPPSLLVTSDGETVSEAHREATSISGGAPGLTSVCGPDLLGRVFANRNLSGTGDLLVGVYNPPSPVTRATVDAKATKSVRQVFTAAGTWAKPAGAVSVRVEVIGSGGGGGAGRRTPSGTVGCGGGSGGSGGYSWGHFDASTLPDTVPVAVGTGGAGGTPPATDNTNGGNGSNGGASTFGSPALVRATGGTGGSGGTTSTGSGGARGNGMIDGQNGTAASTTGGSGSAGSNVGGAAAGGSGGGLAATPAAVNGGAGGRNYSSFDAIGTAAGGTAPGGSGTTPTPPADTTAPLLGAGGGGGASSTTGAGGAGGNGSGYGSSGGGGGAALDGNLPGAGGTGGAGVVIVTTYF